MRALDYHSPSTTKQKWAWLGPAAPVGEWCALIVAFICSILMLWAARLPVSNFPAMALGFLIGLVSGFLWMTSLLVEIFVVGSPSRSTRRKAVLLLSTPILLATLSGLLFAEVPRKLMFRANRPAMDRWASQTMATPGPLPTFAHLGSYECFNFEQIPGGFKCLVEGCGFFRSGGGLAYSPLGPPPAKGPAYETFSPLGGGWYARTFEEE